MICRIRRITRSFLSYRAEQKIRRAQGVTIPSSVKLTGADVSLKQDCELLFGEYTEFRGRILFDREGASVKIGSRTFIGSSSIVSADSVEIGSDVLISWGCVIVDHDSHSVIWNNRKDDVTNWLRGNKYWSNVSIAPVRINDKSWLGFNSIILKGVTIGEGAVVGAGSVVTKDVEPYTVVAGNPAKFIKKVESSSP